MSNLEQLKKFHESMGTTLEQLLEIEDKGENSGEQFNLDITWNGVSISLMMNADVFSNFEHFVSETIRDEMSEQDFKSYKNSRR